MGMMGTAAVYVAGPHFVRMEPETYQDPYDIRHRIFYMLYLCTYKYKYKYKYKYVYNYSDQVRKVCST